MKEFAKFASLLALSFTLTSGLHAQDAPEKPEDAPAPEPGVIVQEDGSRLIAWVSFARRMKLQSPAAPT